MMPFDEGRKLVLSDVRRTEPIHLPVDRISGYVLAEPIITHEDVPRFDSSAVDGFALRSGDAGSAAEPVRLCVSATVRAGDDSGAGVTPGSAIRIMTGARMPAGADSVVMKEYVHDFGDTVSIGGTVAPGENVRRAGEELRGNETAIPAGVTLDASHAGFLAGLGYAAVPVYRKPRVSVVTTGSELAAADKPLSPAGIRDVNSYYLSCALRETGFHDIALYPRIPDRKSELAAALEEALADADVVIVTGGVSVGEYDYVKEILRQLGVAEIFWKLAVKPGKPVFFGRTDKAYVFGLPGNPVAVGVLYHELVRPLLLAMSGHRNVLPPRISASLGASITKRTPRLEFVCAALSHRNGEAVAYPMKGRGSHMMGSFAGAGGLILFPEQLSELRAGSRVYVDVVREIEYGSV
jgi:molybdopterin molybdotransferase